MEAIFLLTGEGEKRTQSGNRLESRLLIEEKGCQEKVIENSVRERMRERGPAAASASIRKKKKEEESEEKGRTCPVECPKEEDNTTVGAAPRALRCLPPGRSVSRTCLSPPDGKKKKKRADREAGRLIPYSCSRPAIKKKKKEIDLSLDRGRSVLSLRRGKPVGALAQKHARRGLKNYLPS